MMSLHGSILACYYFKGMTLVETSNNADGFDILN
jgi:hypothetical protein